MSIMSVRLEFKNPSLLYDLKSSHKYIYILFNYLFKTFPRFFSIKNQSIINLYRLYLIKSRLGFFYYLGRPFYQRTHSRSYKKKKKKNFVSVHRYFKFFFKSFS